VADLEMVLVVHDLLAAIGVGGFTIRVNDRRVLAGVLAECGVADRSAAVLRALDKLGKATPDAVAAELEGHGVPAGARERLLGMARLAGPPDAVLAALAAAVGGSAVGRAGLDALERLLAGARAAGVPEGRVVVDPSIARGLDYYTGIVLESFLDDLPALGSICSGGRYDDLAGLYTKQHLPGVGASLGIDRLLAGLEELGRTATVETPAEVFLVHFDERHLADYLRVAAAIRAAGMAVEFFPEPRKVGQQLKLAAKRGFAAALVIGSDEFAAGTAQLKDLAAQKSVTIDWHGDLHVLADAVHSQLEAIRAAG
jgi:histidyl-tRNA synthetase